MGTTDHVVFRNHVFSSLNAVSLWSFHHYIRLKLVSFFTVWIAFWSAASYLLWMGYHKSTMTNRAQRLNGQPGWLMVPDVTAVVLDWFRPSCNPNILCSVEDRTRMATYLVDAICNHQHHFQEEQRKINVGATSCCKLTNIWVSLLVSFLRVIWDSFPSHHYCRWLCLRIIDWKVRSIPITRQKGQCVHNKASLTDITHLWLSFILDIRGDQWSGRKGIRRSSAREPADRPLTGTRGFYL